MNEAWFNPGWLGLLGGFVGILGALVGILAGIFIPKGKAKKLVLGVNTFAFGVGFISLVVGVIAYFSGQPYGIWYGFGLCGLLGTVSFGILFFVFRYEYRKAELRKSMSEDLTLSGNKENDGTSDE
ncbi:MAG: hypothetical protein OXL96_11890 [Candidatus Poribacteria bacterium]|nr:hypothetical protein [Candidatus Poribacteria bacterium]